MLFFGDKAKIKNQSEILAANLCRIEKAKN